eukprot:TRINITY_DN6173_c0_g1_i1.p1 TRINITY_DN6173_c0_g1~~TRINITY_DN6173_c0_g1_i1.p1  ORF type:complete len:117 (+),score=25.24 TRINITY_DN6173_c0_g1_i1:110-460(+)
MEDIAVLEKEIEKQKEVIKELQKKKQNLEIEEHTLVQQLSAPGGLGLKGNLVDKEGFPLDNVGLVLETRSARHRLACIGTDQKETMKEIEEQLYRLHALSKKLKEFSPSKTSSSAK